MATVHQVALELARGFEAAYAADVAGLSAAFTEDAVLTPPEAPVCIGREAIRSYYESHFQQREGGLSSATAATEQNGGSVLSWGEYSTSIKPKAGGAPMTLDENWLCSSRIRKDGSLQIAHHAWSITPQQATGPNKSVILHWFEEFNRGKEAALAVLDQLTAEHYVAHGPSTRLNGREEPRRWIASLIDGFPDLQMLLKDMLAEGDKVVSRFVCTGTHQGEFMRMAPSVRRMAVDDLTIAHVEAGKVVEEWQAWFVYGMLQQLCGEPGNLSN